MTHQIRTFGRRAIWALPLWAAMLFLSTLTHQPDPQTAFADFAAYVTTNEFLVSHLFNSIFGAVIGSIGVIGLMLFLQDSKAAGKALTGMVATVAANTLTASIFGVAAFAQPAMGRAFLAGQENALDFYNNVYSAPLLITALVSPAVHRWRNIDRDGHRCLRPLAALGGMGICSHHHRFRSQQLPFPRRTEHNISLALRRHRCPRVECRSRSLTAKRTDRNCCSRLAAFA